MISKIKIEKNAWKKGKKKLAKKNIKKTAVEQKKLNLYI